MSVPEPRLLPPKTCRAWWLALVILICAPLFFGALSLWLGQDVNWDMRNYHYYNAYAFLNNRYGFDLLPSQVQFFLNPLIDVPLYLLATYFPARTVGFIIGFVDGLNFILLFMLAYVVLKISGPVRKVIFCAMLAAIGMYGGEGIAEIGTTYYDNITSLGVLLSVLLVIRYWKIVAVGSGRQAFGCLFLSGIPCGLMAGLKLPALVFCIGLCGGFLFARLPWRRRFLAVIVFGFGVLAGVAITYGYWAWFLQSHYGSPVFPFFNDIFHSPMGSSVALRDDGNIPGNLKDFFLFPFLFAADPFRVGEIDWRDWRILVLYALLPLALALRFLFRRKRAQPDPITNADASHYLLGMAGISYLVWLVSFSIYRYLLSLEMLAPLLLVCAVDLLPLSLRKRAWIMTVVLIGVVVAMKPGD